MKSLDKKKANNSLSDVRNKVVKPNKTKELDWRDKIDWVDDWLEIDCQVIFGEKGKKTLIKFIEYLLTQQRTELLEGILNLECLKEEEFDESDDVIDEEVREKRNQLRKEIIDEINKL